MKRLSCLVLTGFLFATFLRPARGQSGTPPTGVLGQGDYAKAEEEYPNPLGWKYHDNLHDFPLLPDGSKGYSMPLSIERNLSQSVADMPPLQDEDEYNLHDLACYSSAIAIATFVGSEAHLSQDKSNIFTRNHFVVKSLIREGSGVVIGSAIDVIDLGGTVVDAGERLTVTVPNAVPYGSHKTYLLFLFHDSRASANVFSSSQLTRDIITPENIIRVASSNILAVIHDGESVDDLRQRIQTAIAKKACRQLGVGP